MEEILHQLMSVNLKSLTGFLTSQVVVWDFFHQQYCSQSVTSPFIATVHATAALLPPRFAEKLQEFQDHIQCTQLDHLRLVVFRGFIRGDFFFLKDFSLIQNGRNFWRPRFGQFFFYTFLGHHSPENSRNVPLKMNGWEDVLSYSNWSLFRGHMNFPEGNHFHFFVDLSNHVSA